MTAPGLRRDISEPSGSYIRSANTSLAVRSPSALPAFNTSDRGMANTMSDPSYAATARTIAIASSGSFAATLNNSPCAFTCCMRTPSARATPPTAAI